MFNTFFGYMMRVHHHDHLLFNFSSICKQNSSKTKESEKENEERGEGGGKRGEKYTPSTSIRWAI
jgi:hypothetical protein